MIGIVLAAAQIDPQIVLRFQDALAESRPSVDYAAQVDCQHDAEGFNISKAKNRGILAVCRTCEAIVCTDVDMLVPPGLVDFTAEIVRPGRALWALCRNIDGSQIWPRQWDTWRTLPLRRTGMGSWVAMHAADWFRVGGWDERLRGWGGDDTILAERRAAAGIETVQTTDYPLMHVNHQLRGDAAIRGRQENRDNLAVGRTPAPENFLLARLRAEENRVASACRCVLGTPGSKRCQAPLCAAPFGPFRQRCLTPF